MYFSSVPSKENKDLCPEQNGVIRTFTHYGMHKFEMVKREKPASKQKMFSYKDQDEENPYKTEQVNLETCIKMTSLLQCDPKLPNWKFVAYKLAMPQMSKQYYNDLIKFLKSK